MTSSEDLSGRTGRIDPATAAQAFGPEGEAALVTGGGSGLGLGMARAFVAAGGIDSAMMQQAMQGNPARRQRVPHRTPLGRFGEAADIGWAAVHLRSPAARFVTGVVLPVDGGVSIGF